MKHGLTYTLGLIFLGMAGNPAGAATTAAGPYYANPSWDQQLPASTRFVVLSNWIDAAHPSGGAAVLDRETGLVWERSPSASGLSWFNALFSCNALPTGGRLGWRLPTLQELASLVDPSVPFPGPALPSGHPFTNVQSSTYWSATAEASGTVPDTSSALFVYFNGVAFVGIDPKSNSHLSWCVRGGQGVDLQ